MSDFLSTGISGLFAFKRAIDVTSHNIANVGTEGYSRQRAEFATRSPQAYGNGYVGSGVAISTTSRAYDELLAESVRNASSSFSNLDTYTGYVEKLNNMFGDTKTGLTASLQKFANALQDVANNPSSLSSRQVFLSQAQSLSERLKSYDSQLSTLDSQIESSLKSEVTDISAISKNLAQLNTQIASGYAVTGNSPNDLLDQRDRLLDQLSSHIDISTVKQPDGQVNVFIGTGQTLVVGANASTLNTTTDPYDPERHGVSLVSGNGVPVDITSQLKGGSLGGALDFRSNALDAARNQLGRISAGLVDVVNEQHKAGVDLSGNLGGDVFSIGTVETHPKANNAGNATLGVTRSDVNALTDADYYLQRTASGWSLRREDTGASVTMTGTGTSADPFVADGMSIVVNNTASTGDSFLLQPTREAAKGLNVLITDPARIAAASPVKTGAASTNLGDGQISAGTVVDRTNANLRSPSTIAFTSATTYTVNGGAAQTYTSGQPITVNGVEFNITGAPRTGDTFTLADNTGGTGDNRNAQALYDALGSKSLDNGTASLNDVSSRMVGNIGVITSQAQASRDAQQVVQQDAIDARDSVSGVNLDEEAANLIKYQQAYQAAAQMIGVASTLFDSLLAAVRR